MLIVGSGSPISSPDVSEVSTPATTFSAQFLSSSAFSSPTQSASYDPLAALFGSGSSPMKAKESTHAPVTPPTSRLAALLGVTPPVPAKQAPEDAVPTPSPLSLPEKLGSPILDERIPSPVVPARISHTSLAKTPSPKFKGKALPLPPPKEDDQVLRPKRSVSVMNRIESQPASPPPAIPVQQASNVPPEAQKLPNFSKHRLPPRAPSGRIREAIEHPSPSKSSSRSPSGPSRPLPSPVQSKSDMQTGDALPTKETHYPIQAKSRKSSSSSTEQPVMQARPAIAPSSTKRRYSANQSRNPSESASLDSHSTKLSQEQPEAISKSRFEYCFSALGSDILPFLLPYISWQDVLALRYTSSKLLRCFDTAELREIILEHFLGQFGYRTIRAPERSVTILPGKAKVMQDSTNRSSSPFVQHSVDLSTALPLVTLMDMKAFFFGLEQFEPQHYADIARDHKKTPFDHGVIRMVKSTCRAYTKVVLRIRAQSSVLAGEAANAMSKPKKPLFKPGRSLVLRVFVPTRKSWMSDEERVKSKVLRLLLMLLLG